MRATDPQYPLQEVACRFGQPEQPASDLRQRHPTDQIGLADAPGRRATRQVESSRGRVTPEVVELPVVEVAASAALFLDKLVQNLDLRRDVAKIEASLLPDLTSGRFQSALRYLRFRLGIDDQIPVPGGDAERANWVCGSPQE